MAFASTSVAQPRVATEQVQAWLDDYVIPSYKRLHQANLALQQQADHLCDDLSLTSLDRIKPAFIEAIQALAYTQAIDGGPMQGQLRSYKLYFWPDRNNLIEKQLNRLLAKGDTALLVEGGLTDASVALTGYPALERLIFVDSYREKVIADKSHYACQYIAALSSNIATISQQVIEEWQGQWYQHIMKPGASEGIIKNHQDQVSFIFTNTDFLLTKIIHKKLSKPLASSAQKAKPKRMESWRSRQSLRLLEINIQALVHSLSLTLQPALTQAGHPAQWQHIEQQLKHISQQMKGSPQPLMNQLHTPSIWNQVQQIQLDLVALQSSLQDLYPSLGVRLGFNAYDGD